MARSSSGSAPPRELLLFARRSIPANIRRSIAISICTKRKLGPAEAGPGSHAASVQEAPAALHVLDALGDEVAQLPALLGREHLQRLRGSNQGVLLHRVLGRGLPVDEGLRAGEIV